MENDVINSGKICDALKLLGVREVILGVDSDGHPMIEFNGFGGDPGEHFKIQMDNHDFSEHEL